MANGNQDRDARLVSLMATGVALVAFVVYWRRGDLLLYGDAVAHIGAARRVIDSLTPGFGQLGTVWLPLPHLLMIPFVAPLAWWRVGAAASVPSLVAYVLATLAVYRLVREGAGRSQFLRGMERPAAWLAAAIFAANPNVLYLAATAMTEPLYLALWLWSLVWLQRFAADSAGPRARRALVLCGVLLCAAEWTRYDGWFAAAFLVPTAFVAWLRSWLRRRERPAISMPGFALFLVLVALGPMGWFWWNYSNTGNALDFANGPYSARGIEQRVKNKIDARAHPGEGDPAVAASYYLHAVAINLGEKRWGPALLIAATAGGLLVLVLALRRKRPPLIWLLLWIPLPFYINSVAWGSVPIFTPYRWPYSYYNVRYGVEMLPAVAVFVAALATWLANRRERGRRLAMALSAVFVAGAYLSCYWQQPNRPKSLLPDEPWLGPIAWREAKINAATRMRFEQKLAAVLESLPPNSTVLMYTGDHVGALQRAGVALSRVTNEANYYAWRLAQVTPAAAADYVVATAGDAVAAAVAADPEDLTPIAAIDVAGQPHTVVYRAEHPKPAAHEH